jgi:hypothetical protein
MKQYFAVALFAAMAFFCGSSLSRAADDGAAMNLEPLRQKLCSTQSADVADMLFSNVEFDIRVEYMMSGEIDQPLPDILAEAREQIRNEAKDFDMNLQECVLVKSEPMACTDGARYFAPNFAAMYAYDEETGPDSVEKFILMALEDMGVTQCGTATLSATVLVEGSDRETVVAKFFIGKKADGWTPLVEMDDEAESE